MRLPQDQILHIDTEVKDGKVNITAEWQGEIVRCNDCKHQEHCEKTVAHKRGNDGFNVKWLETIEWCSRGERRE